MYFCQAFLSVVRPKHINAKDVHTRITVVEAVCTWAWLFIMCVCFYGTVLMFPIKVNN